VYVVDIWTGDNGSDTAYVDWAHRNLFDFYHRAAGDIVMFIARGRDILKLEKIIHDCTNLILFDVDCRRMHFDKSLKIEPIQFLYDAWGYATRKKFGYLNVDFGNGAQYYYYPSGREKPKFYSGLFIEPGVL